VSGIDLSLKRGSFTCIVGRSGCGKTTLLNLLAGFLRPTAGSLRLDGSEIVGCGRDRGVVFQSTNALLPWLTVAQNVELGLKIARVSQHDRAKRTKDILEMLDLGHYADSPIYQLSGGMQQRVAIGRALVMDPEILLMDEPFGALDALTRTVLQRELLDIWRRQRFTGFFITHSVEEALILGTEVVVMSGSPGRIKERIQVPDDDNFQRQIDNPKFADLEKEVLRLVMEE